MRDENEQYEQLAAEFYRDTGMMAPGKDVPAAMGCIWSPRERFEKWNEWLTHRKAQP